MRIFYVNNYGESVYLDQLPYMMLSDTDIFNYEWGYSTKANKTLYNVKKNVVKNKIKIRIFGNNEHDFYNNVDELTKVFDRDTIEEKQGKLCFINDNDKEYYLLCNVISSKKQKFIKKNNSIFEFEILSNGFWTREVEKVYRISDEPINYGKMYDYGFPYDYAPMASGQSTMYNEHFEPVDFEMEIGGIAHYPQVTIGDNIYSVNCDVGENEFLVINSKNKTIELHHNDARGVENVFRYRNKEHYIFKKIPSGFNPIIWSGNYTVSVTQLIERSEPKWT